ncbi:MAG: hypothetical protein ACR2P0_07155 [Acidimicrobiales bacterium]
MTSSRRFSAGTQVALGLLIVISVFAGGMAIAQALPSGSNPVASADPTLTLPDHGTLASDPGELTTPDDPAPTEQQQAPTAAGATTPTQVKSVDPEPAPAAVTMVDDTDEEATDPCRWTPSAEDIAENNETTAALATLLMTYGVEFSEEADEVGFTWLEWGYDDPVVESIVQSFWAGRYPSAEMLAEQVAYNDSLAAALTEAGIEFELVLDEEWAWIEFDWSDDHAADVSAHVHEEFYGPIDDVPEECLHDEGHWEPSEEELAEQTELNAALIAALEAGGHGWTQVDDGTWSWIEYDYDDDAANDAVNGVYEEFYGPFDQEYCEPHADDAEWQTQVAERSERLGRLALSLETAGVTVEFIDDEYGSWLTFDIDNSAAVEIVKAEMAEPAVG